MAKGKGIEGIDPDIAAMGLSQSAAEGWMEMSGGAGSLFEGACESEESVDKLRRVCRALNLDVKLKVRSASSHFGDPFEKEELPDLSEPDEDSVAEEGDEEDRGRPDDED